MGNTLKKYQIMILASTLFLMGTLQVIAKNRGFLKGDSLRLDDKRRVVQMNLTAETIRKSPYSLLVPITKIKNQNNIPLMIRIKMIWGEKGSPNKKVIGIGNFSILHPAQTGVYSQQLSKIFEHVNVLAEEIEEGEKEVALVFEMAPFSKKESLEGVEVVIDPVRWETHPLRPISEN